MHGDSDEISAENGAFPILRARGRPRKHGQQNDASRFLKPYQYNTKAHWIARLDRNHPDLARLVRAGTLTANAAAVQAGFRRRAQRKALRAKLAAVEALIG
jgi:hypothetical protein